MTDSDALLPLDAVRRAEPSKPGKGAPVPAPSRPVARVAVDNPLPHLDRPFDYLVPASMHETAEPGVRVRVRFAGQLVDGFVLERVEESDHTGKLTALERVVSGEQVLTGEIAGLARAVADRYAGTLADVLRLAIPPRHARAEATTPKPAATAGTPTASPAQPAGPAAPANDISSGPVAGPSSRPTSDTPGGTPAGADSGHGPAAGGGPRSAPVEAGNRPRSAVVEAGDGSDRASAGPWDDYPMGPSFLDALRNGRAPRAVWSALPGAKGWAGAVAEAVRATLDGGRGAVVVVPDGKDVALADAELTRVLGDGMHVALTADLGPAERYRRWLRVLRGQVRAVVGTRAATFAPVAALGLVAIWDDGDDLHAERLAPYPHAREVLALRAHRTGAAMLIGGYTRTAEATQLIASRWARPIVAPRATIRSLAPRVHPAGEDAELAKDQAARQARLPSLAWRALRQGLESGPVLVQVPRRGYLPALACQNCRAPARCALPPTRLSVPTASDAQANEPHAVPGPAVATTAGRRSAVGTKNGGAKNGGTRRGAAKDAGGSAAGPASGGGSAEGLWLGSGLADLPGSGGRAGGLPGAGDRPNERPGSGDRPGGRSGPGDRPGGRSGPGDRLGGGPGSGDRPVERSGSSDRSADRPGSRDSSVEGPGSSRGPAESLGGPTSIGEGSRSPSCHGPLALRGGHTAPYCRWCGRVDAGWRCPNCGGRRLRAVVVGARRTAEELGRAFPSVPVRTSGRDGVLATVPATRALVVATPGAEPVAEGGYAAAVLLDGWALLGRADLRAAEEALRRWTNAAALLRPGAEVVVLGDAGLPAVQALVRWDPITHAERELAERAELGFPPAVRMATLTGAAAAVRQMLDETRLPDGAQVLGPVPVDEAGRERAMIRVPRGGGAALAAALKGASGVRAARKAPDVVRVSVDPLDLI
ncbi:primosomal protein N' [Nonomuraea sp. NPDC049269]|uniref:primosomal protein N' family DNA-binding protein n=1 Tax=Nonomuraea sp. NPDC049269 TaxID=3364349 RepID=UPI003717C604